MYEVRVLGTDHERVLGPFSLIEAEVLVTQFAREAHREGRFYAFAISVTAALRDWRIYSD